MAEQQLQRWDLSAYGHGHRVEIDGSVSRSIRWYVDDRLVARKRSSDDDVQLRPGDGVGPAHTTPEVEPDAAPEPEVDAEAALRTEAAPAPEPGAGRGRTSTPPEVGGGTSTQPEVSGGTSAERAGHDGTEEPRDGDLGALGVKFTALGRARRVTLYRSEGGVSAAARAVLGTGGIDLDPEPGSPAALREERIRRHPRRHAALATLAGVVKVVLPLLLGLLAVRLTVSIPWPDWDLPSIPWPDWDLPSIPWPDIDLPSIPWPDLQVPAWVRWIAERLKYVGPVVLALVLASAEVRRRRQQDALKARLRAEAAAAVEGRPARTDGPPSAPGRPEHTDAPPSARDRPQRTDDPPLPGSDTSG